MTRERDEERRDDDAVPIDREGAARRQLLALERIARLAADRGEDRHRRKHERDRRDRHAKPAMQEEVGGLLGTFELGVEPAARRRQHPEDRCDDHRGEAERGRATRLRGEQPHPFDDRGDDQERDREVDHDRVKSPEELPEAALGEQQRRGGVER
jgi:hypothetical protein